MSGNYFSVNYEWNLFSENKVCRSYGANRMRTFDGALYNIRGNCQYTLVEDEDIWEITLDFEYCKSWSDCVKVR